MSATHQKDYYFYNLRSIITNDTCRVENATVSCMLLFTAWACNDFFSSPSSTIQWSALSQLGLTTTQHTISLYTVIVAANSSSFADHYSFTSWEAIRTRASSPVELVHNVPPAALHNCNVIPPSSTAIAWWLYEPWLVLNEYSWPVSYGINPVSLFEERLIHNSRLLL